MPPDPRRISDTASWVAKASQDIRYAEIDLAAQPAAPEDAVFHCQQAIEKTLKAFLVWHDEPFQKTHDLGRLGKQAVQIDPTLEPLVEGIVDLTTYAWLFRCPGDPVGPTAEEHRTRWAEHGGFRLRSWRGCRTTPTHHRHEAISPGERLA